MKIETHKQYLKSVREAKKIKIFFCMRNFSQNSKKEQDKALKWIEQLPKDFRRLRKHIAHTFTGEY